MTLSGEELFPPEPPKPSTDILKVLIPALGVVFTVLALLGFVLAFVLRPSDEVKMPNGVADLFTYDIPAEFLVATDSSASEIQQLLNEIDGNAEPAAASVAEATVEEVETIDIPAVMPAEKLTRWQRNRQPAPAVPKDFSKVVLIIDDMGLDPAIAQDLLSLPAGVTLSFLPYGKDSLKIAAKAHKDGHEILVHLPMQAVARADGSEISPGPDALYTNMTAEQVQTVTRKNMRDYLNLAVGSNNHMGSAASADEDVMRVVLSEMANDELIFIDSVTTNKTVVSKVAKEFPDLPLLKRNIFLDNVRTEEAISKQLAELVKSAQKHGQAIGIGHPYPETLAVLQRELPTFEKQKITLVPVSALVETK